MTGTVEVHKCYNAVTHLYLLKSHLLFKMTGLSATGLYRISGNLADIQSLRFMINKGERVS